MPLNENEKEFLDYLYYEKRLPILERYQRELKRIDHINDNNKHSLYFRVIQDFAREVIDAHVTAYIEAYQRVGKYPNEEDFESLAKELKDEAVRFKEYLAERYGGPFSPLPPDFMEVLVESLRLHLEQIPGFAIPPVRRFMSEAKVPVFNNRGSNYDMNRILSNVFVLESEEGMIQGSCFNLEGIGIVTCEHVLHPDLEILHPSDVSKKYKVDIVFSNSVIDIARIDAPGLQLNEGLQLGSTDDLEIMDSIAIAGYPNYRLGDTGIINTGNIIGFRTVSSIRRILVSTPIIAGNSGGPVLDAEGAVIGVAITGADRMEESSLTENHAVVPIDALSFLKND